MPESDAPRIDRFYLAVGERVRGARTAARMTQARLATQLGLTRSSVANIEAGRQRIQLHMFAMIAEALDVEPAKLLPDDLMTPAPPDLSRVEEHLVDAEESSREFVQSMLAQLVGNPESKE